MHSFRSIILIFALLVQALPATMMVAQTEETKVCQMACCQAQTLTCCCIEAPDAPTQPAPANTPPATGRELLPSSTWVIAHLPLYFLPVPLTAEKQQVSFVLPDEHPQSHVRLPVLLCSILI
jgi:hypothetical protein